MTKRDNYCKIQDIATLHLKISFLIEKGDSKVTTRYSGITPGEVKKSLEEAENPICLNEGMRCFLGDVYQERYTDNYWENLLLSLEEEAAETAEANAAAEIVDFGGEEHLSYIKRCSMRRARRKYFRWKKRIVI